MDYIIFNIAGGIGKNIMATAVVEAIKKHYPEKKIIVTTPWAIAFENNPFVYRVVNAEQSPTFYEDYIKDKNSILFRLDPYNAEDFIYRRKHLLEIWCDLCGVPYNGELPKLYFTEEENNRVKEKLQIPPGPLSQVGVKPLFFIQPSGGAFNQAHPVSWARDIPINITENVVQKMNEAGYRTIHIRRANQIPVRGAEWIDFSLREAMRAFQFSSKRLLTDSFGAHAAAAFNLPSVVTWVVNSPEVFGYKMHTNILAEGEKDFRHDIDGYLDQYNIIGNWHEFPYKTDQIFSAEEILKYLL